MGIYSLQHVLCSFVWRPGTQDQVDISINEGTNTPPKNGDFEK